MDDLEIMQRAKTYIDKMANGIDPVTGREAAETDMINNARISRCLSYVSGILQQVIENGGVPTAQDNMANPKKKKEPFCLTDKQLEDFRYSDSPISITEITKRFNELLDNNKHKKLETMQLTSWLVKVGLLQIISDADGKKRKMPTAYGNDIGIITETRNGKNGEYPVVLYRIEAQQFLADHHSSVGKWITAGIADEAEIKKKERLEELAHPWSKASEEEIYNQFLIKLFSPQKSKHKSKPNPGSKPG